MLHEEKATTLIRLNERKISTEETAIDSAEFSDI